MRVFITGVSGLLGANLAVELRSSGHDIAGVYHEHAFRFPGMDTFACDIRNDAAVRQAVERKRPEWIVHCAAATNVDWCEDHPAECYEFNSTLPGRIATIARDLGIRLLYISTDSVFDGTAGNYTEEDSTSPRNVYAESKLRGEISVFSAMATAVVLRTNLFGWNAQRKASLAEWVLDNVSAGRGIKGFIDVVFAPLLVNDLASIIEAIMQRQLMGLYHAGSADACSKFDFAVRICSAFGFDPALVTPARLADVSFRAPRPKDTSLNSAKLQSALAQEPPDVRSGIERFRALRDAGLSAELRAACT